MAKKQSNTSENSAASQSAKPGMFIPIPTAEITSAAETARIRAEREAKEKADKKAADAVVALIRAIGVVEYTDACREKINAAKQAYTKLTADQKKLVDNADVITTSEKEYDKLKIAAEKEAKERAAKEAKEKADKKAADAVVALISAIGVVEYTDACLKKINAAKQAYAKLTADQKKLVENADVISASEKDYNELKSAIDKQAADEVITMIKNIGVIECTSDCVAKINVAKLAYDKLSPDQEGLVDMQVGDILLRMADVAKRYAAVIAEKRANERTEKEAKEKADKKAAADVTTMISAIGTVKYTAACLKKIEAAKQAYVQLTSDQKLLVENASVILASKKEYERLKIAAEEKEARKKEAERKKKRNIILIIASLLLISILYILFAGIEGGDTHSESKVLKELNTTDNSSFVSRHNHYNENLEQKRIEAEQEKAKITNYKRNIVYAKSAEELLNIYNAIQQEDMNKDSAQVLLGLAAEMLYFCYKDGVGGVSQDQNAAIKWLEKAANHGNPDALEISKKESKTF